MKKIKELYARAIQFKNLHPYITILLESIVTIGVMVGLVFFVLAIKVPNPNMLLVPSLIVFTSLFGFIPGCFSVIVCIVFSMYLFSTDHSFFNYTSDGIYQLIVVMIGAFLCYIFVSLLNYRSNKSYQKLAKINKFLELDNQQLQEISISDSLTRTKNRFALRKDFEKYCGQFVHVMMFDIDNFKKVNDTLGHSVGDYVLKCIGAVTKEIFTMENCYRYGGDEFLIICPEMSEEDFKSKAKDLKQAINGISVGQKNISTRFSGGYVYGFPESPLELRAMIKKADTLLYKAKSHGKDDIIREEFSAK